MSRRGYTQIVPHRKIYTLPQHQDYGDVARDPYALDEYIGDKADYEATAKVAYRGNDPYELDRIISGRKPSPFGVRAVDLSIA